MNHPPAPSTAPGKANADPVKPINAIQAFIAKCQMYFGQGLAPRVIPLNLTIPTPSERVNAGRASSHDLKLLVDTPLEYFELLHERVKYMNYGRFSTRQRERINEELIALFYPMALTQLSRHSRSGGIPEPEHRGKLLAHISEIAGILITSHLVLFSACYEGGNFRYARQRPRLYRWVSHMFELPLLKQRCLGLRHQLLDAGDWKMVNTVFYLMAVYEDVQRPLHSLKQQFKMGGTTASNSLAQLFSALHLHAWFDLLCLPSHLHSLIAKYLDSVPNAVSVGIETVADSEFNLRTHCHAKYPASRKMTGDAPDYPIVISIKTLVLTMAQDIFPLMNKPTPLAKPPGGNKFKALPLADQYILRNHFIQLLKFEDLEFDNSLAHNFDDFRIYVGYAEVLALLLHRHSHAAAEARLSDWLAKRSANMAHDEKSEQTTTWFFLFQHGDRMRLSTDELANSIAMNIGSLVAYGMADEIQRPKIGVVSRIQRAAHQQVQIDIQFIADYAQAVTITFETAGATAKTSAVLIFNPNGATPWQLICPPLRRLDPLRQLSVHRKSQTVAASAQELLCATAEYFILGTNLRSSDLQFAERPEYPAPSPEANSAVSAFRISAS